MKVVLAPIGTEGDVRPLASLARSLQDAGHETRFLVSPDLVEICTSVGVSAIPAGRPLKPEMERINKEGNGKPIQALKAMALALRNGISDEFDAHAPYGDWADLFVGSAPFQFATAAFAERRGVGGLLVGHVGSIVPSRFQPPPNVPRPLPRPFNSLIWRASFALMELAIGKRLASERAKLGLGRMVGGLRGQKLPILVAMDPGLWPMPADAPPHAHQCGYLRRPDEEELPREVEAFLANGDAPIYLGFGSMASEDSARTSRIVSEALQTTGMRAIVSQGWSTIAGASEQVLVCGHLPHTRLFPRMSVIVHHGGAGTSWTASRSGTPQVVVPHMMDQPGWALRLRALGLAAKPIPCQKLSAKLLADGLMEAKAMGRGGARETMRKTLEERDGLAEAVALLESMAPSRR
jgi:UDP:flavonoid glycosyltransferase YjiC (YdhE family)